jgi:hypothetical protein
MKGHYIAQIRKSLAICRKAQSTPSIQYPIPIGIGWGAGMNEQFAYAKRKQIVHFTYSRSRRRSISGFAG